MKTESSHTPLDYTKESLKVTKNSRGYTWEFKLISDKLNQDDVKRSAEIDDWLMSQFGGPDV